MDASITAIISVLLAGLIYLCCFTKTFSGLGEGAHEFANEYNKGTHESASCSPRAS